MNAVPYIRQSPDAFSESGLFVSRTFLHTGYLILNELIFFHLGLKYTYKKGKCDTTAACCGL